MTKKTKGNDKVNNTKTSTHKQSIEEEFLLNWFRDNGVMEEVDEAAQSSTQAEISDNTYQDITKKIVDITEYNLKNQATNKESLRKPLQNFIIVILLLQLLILVIVLVFNSGYLHLDSDIIKTYIVSVFAETLLGLTIMIRFAFSTKQEVELISILNSVVSNFKVFGTTDSAKNDKGNDKN